MKKIIGLLVLVTLLLSCSKYDAEKDSKVIDNNYIVFENQKCPIVDIKFDGEGGGVVVKRVNGEVVGNIKKVGDAFDIVSSKDGYEYGFSCNCNCCGCRWSVRKEDVPFQNCFNCPGWQCSGQIQNPYFYFTCNCGHCLIFIIEIGTLG